MTPSCHDKVQQAFHSASTSDLALGNHAAVTVMGFPPLPPFSWDMVIFHSYDKIIPRKALISIISYSPDSSWKTPSLTSDTYQPCCSSYIIGRRWTTTREMASSQAICSSEDNRQHWLHCGSSKGMNNAAKTITVIEKAVQN